MVKHSEVCSAGNGGVAAVGWGGSFRVVWEAGSMFWALGVACRPQQPRGDGRRLLSKKHNGDRLKW